MVSPTKSLVPSGGGQDRGRSMRCTTLTRELTDTNGNVGPPISTRREESGGISIRSGRGAPFRAPKRIRLTGRRGRLGRRSVYSGRASALEEPEQPFAASRYPVAVPRASGVETHVCAKS